MVRFFTDEFFQELSRLANESPEFQEVADDLSLRILVVCEDIDRSYLLDIDDGEVRSVRGSSQEDVDFIFTSSYDGWAEVAQNRSTLPKKVLMGQVKFEGSMPKLMSLFSEGKRLEGLLDQMEVDFSPPSSLRSEVKKA